MVATVEEVRPKQLGESGRAGSEYPSRRPRLEKTMMKMCFDHKIQEMDGRGWGANIEEHAYHREFQLHLGTFGDWSVDMPIRGDERN